MTKIIQITDHKRRKRLNFIRETVLEVTGRRLSDDEIYDCYDELKEKNAVQNKSKER